MSLIETGIVVDRENYQAANDLTIDTGYFGDDETSSGNLSPQSKSDSDDNSSEISFEGINNINSSYDQTDIKRDKILVVVVVVVTLFVCFQSWLPSKSLAKNQF